MDREPPEVESPASVDTETPDGESPASDGEGPPILATRDLKLRFRITERGAAEIVGTVLHYTLDGGQSWVATKTQESSALVSFHAPGDGRYGFRLEAVDAVGAHSPAPVPGDLPDLEAIIDTTPPTLRILRPEQLTRILGDQRVEIEWQTRDSNLASRPVEIAASRNGGPWETLWRNLPASGRQFWHAPLLPGEVRLLFRVRDKAGNYLETRTPPVYQVDTGRSPSSRWVAASRHSRSREVSIYYKVVRNPEDNDSHLLPEDLRKVQVWYRSEGMVWNRGDLDPDRRSPLVYRASSDGWYDLLVTAVDRNGNWIPSDTTPLPDGRPDRNLAPHIRVLVDTLEPRVQILSPVSGAWIDGGAPLSIQYSVEEENPRPEPVTISSSLDGGQNWTELATALAPEPVEDGQRFLGKFELNLPVMGSEHFLLKVTAMDAAANLGDATTDLTEAITIRNPRENQDLKADEHYRRGVLLSRSAHPGDRRLALKSFRKALTYQPNHAAAHHDLAVTLASVHPDGPDENSPLDEARVHFRKAYEVDPRDPKLAFSLVGALLRTVHNRDEDSSREYQEEAESIFRKISWTSLVELADEDKDEFQRYRRQYRAWKELYFNRIPR